MSLKNLTCFCGFSERLKYCERFCRGVKVEKYNCRWIAVVFSTCAGFQVLGYHSTARLLYFYVVKQSKTVRIPYVQLVSFSLAAGAPG